MNLLLLLFFALVSSSEEKIEKGFGPGEQDYGYVQVREGSFMFWWLYYTSANVSNPFDRPLILWLQGGPGGSGTGHGNFGSIGPLDEELRPREYSWVKDFNILFVDCPVGAGYSFVVDLRYLAKTNKQIGEDMVQVIKAFLNKIPQFKRTKLFIHGDGYGAKMGADFVKLLHEEIKIGNIECDLAGLSMSNTWVSPIDIVNNYAPYLFQVSLIDENGMFKLKQQTNFINQKIEEKQYYHATLEWLRSLNVVYSLTDGIDFSNIIAKVVKITQQSIKSQQDMFLGPRVNLQALNELMNGKVKEALNIPAYVVWGMQGTNTFEDLYEDFMLPVVETMEYLLNNTNIRIHVLNGNLNFIANTVGQISWINKLKWKEASNFKSAPRMTIWINNTMEGYRKQGGKLSFDWFNVVGIDFIKENPVVTRNYLHALTGF